MAEIWRNSLGSCTDHTKDAQYIERLFLFVADDIIRDI